MGKLKVKMMVLFVCMCILLPTMQVYCAKAGGTLTPSASDNLGIGLRRNSELVPLSDGYMRVFYNGTIVGVEYYDDEFNIQNRKNISMELPIWGGFYAGTDAYYLIEGKNNTDESNEAEVIRVIKYDTGWKRMGATSVKSDPVMFGGQVRYPFDYGCVEVTESNGKLYIVTGHEGYVDDAYRQGHQGFLMITIDESTMSGGITDADLWHSFAQYIVSRDSELYVLEQSEGSRYTSLSRYNTETMQRETIPVLKYGGSRDSAWAIPCYASVNGMAMSANNILCVGTSIDQSKYDSVTEDTPHNIYLTVTPMSDFAEASTKVKWLTAYTGGGKSFLGVKITRVNNNRFMISWEEYGDEKEGSTDDSLSTSTLHYVFINGNGDVVSKEFTGAMPISDCQPVIKGGKAVYYASNDNMVDFYSLNTDTGEIGKKAYRVAGENATWNLYNGVLTISGTGALAINSEGKYRSPVSSASSWLSYSGSDNSWKSIRKYVKKIVVKEGITSIPDSAFAYFDNLEEVELKEGLLSIGSKAFYECGHLDKITIPSSVKKIGEDFLWTGYMWMGGGHVVDATIYAPYNSYAVTYAKTNRIAYRMDLAGAVVSGLKPEYEYTGKKLKPEITVTLGDTVLKAEEDYELVYKNNTEIGTASLEISGTGAYFGTISKTFNIIAPKKAKGTLSGWVSNRKLPAKGKPVNVGTVFKEKKTGIQYKVTKKGKSGKATVEYKKGPKKASNVSIPATVRINGITYKVTSIGTKAFAGNTKLRKITIGKNITSIGKQAFYNCKNLRSIVIKTSTIKSAKVGAKAFKGIYKKAVIKVPAKKLKAYKTMLRKKGIGSKVKVRK